MSRRIAWIVVLSLAEAAGCGVFELVDDVGGSPPESSDGLHDPYVLGARFEISARAIRNRRMDFTDWTIVSDDSTVIAVVDRSRDAEASLEAFGPGATTIRLLDPDGEVRAAETVEVLAPDRIELLSTLALALDTEDAEHGVERPVVLAGGEATYLVRALAGDVLLHGSGAFEADGSEDLDVSVEAGRAGGAANDFVHVAPASPGDHALGVRIGELQIAAIGIEAVASDAVDRLEMLVPTYPRERPQRPIRGHRVAGVRAFDSDARPIDGVAYAWSIDGRGFDDLGDLFRYEHDRRHRATVVARFGPREVRTELEASDGFPASSNSVSSDCAVGTPSRGPWWLLLLLLARRRLAV